MADCRDKCADDCSFDYADDKQRGVCLVKPEFIIEDHIRLLSSECLTADDKQKINVKTNDSKNEMLCEEEPPSKRFKQDDKKEKLRGQNKARPPPFKLPREHNLCPWIADLCSNEADKTCENKHCSFMHDRAEYLKIKPADVGAECHIFNLTGKCPRGIACRVGAKHISSNGFNIIYEEKFIASKTKPPSIKNQISKDLQNKLRKHKYNFTKAESIVKANNPSKKMNSSKTSDFQMLPKVHQEEAKSKIVNGSNKEGSENDPKIDSTPITDTKDENIASSTEAKLGPVVDYDLIALRTGEKKKIDWRDKILLSPLTTVGNLPFRRICKEYGADVTCGEMALAPKILKGAHEEWALVKRHESEDIFGVQLCGNNPGVLTRCAELLEEQTEVDFIDLNLGCPIDLIYRQGGGSGMLNRLNVLETVIKSVSQVLSIPLTVKTRTGVYMDKPIAHNLMPKFRDWGVSMITVHGRSREQRYTKKADWEYIEKCAEAAKPIPVYGNGDILSFDDYERARKGYPAVYGVTIGRGALIKPWIFTEIKEQRLIDISSTERFEMLKKYTNYGLEHWGSDTRGVETTRRFLLEWISFLHRYVPVGILEKPPQRINERPPFYTGRNDMETLMASSNCANWIKISEMLLGKVPDGFHFLPKHKANSWK
ncbi:tRNA-dihydrouridine(47) synthase [NAD(P)(+)]-like [Orussus abietinus]|uniref:tRNA-dihydrouridine(47) synthase [NAD(P)(+)]-like n=1 Tax=Orussus abietinus TaxID=222816 RepID=UPI000626BC48|nr:tRNA-dihydrouridine(47) synthase [NAD(P)(+)]-like [Orussus abietinus]